MQVLSDNLWRAFWWWQRISLLSGIVTGHTDETFKLLMCNKGMEARHEDLLCRARNTGPF